ncbi:unnamed protein product [Symbiodinium necroappetens]|uniref:Uncharacterized protein n=1 Tax=Symbiodinium necroappetens TaxID=1628268 RepID=A0A812XVF3_9DINO|nr:unnamed protein product [Symbiodinium necroappetens]
MGCAGSCPKPVRSTSWDARNTKLSAVLPKGVNLPPDRETHELYVRQLDKYLCQVAKNPKGFENKVEMRREFRFHVSDRLAEKMGTDRHTVPSVKSPEEASWGAASTKHPSAFRAPRAESASDSWLSLGPGVEAL